MTQLPPFCFHNLRHASVRSEPAAGERAAANARSRRALGRRSPSRPGPVRSDAALQEVPRERPKWGLGLAPRDQPWDTEPLPSWRPSTWERSWESRNGTRSRARARPRLSGGGAAAREEAAAPGAETPPPAWPRPRNSCRPHSRQKSTF